MIRRFLFVLRRVIVKVMARAAVPNNSYLSRSQTQQQLGFDFGASTIDVSEENAARLTTSLESTRRQTNAVNEPGVLPFVRTSPSATAGIEPASPVAVANSRQFGTTAALPQLNTIAPPQLGTSEALPQLAQSLNEISPFGVAGGFVAPAPVAPSVAPPSKSRGRAAVRARTAVMFSRLQELGLRGIESLVLMRTRTVMVSLIGQTLRVHEGYADAPEPVLRAIVTFATARHRATRVAARDEILKHDVERAPAVRRAESARPGDLALISSLMQAHREMNVRSFAASLKEIPIRLSGRMATRLGHFDPGSRLTPPEIVMSRRHVVKHGWKEAMHTLLHEMVHQWQHETGQPVDHLAGFRKKCREVGITPAARRDVTPIKPRRRSGAA